MAAALALSTALAFPLCSQAAEDQAIGMPNPIVSYANYGELEHTVGFRPLLLPKGTFLANHYRVDTISAISGKTAQVRYALDDGASFTIRSAKREADQSDDISGVYSGKWKTKTISHTKVHIAKVGKDSWAAHWTEGDYAFSLFGEQMKKKDFQKLLSEVLVDHTEQFYGEGHGNPIARGAQF